MLPGSPVPAHAMHRLNISSQKVHLPPSHLCAVRMSSKLSKVATDIHQTFYLSIRYMDFMSFQKLTASSAFRMARAAWLLVWAWISNVHAFSSPEGYVAVGQHIRRTQRHLDASLVSDPIILGH